MISRPPVASGVELNRKWQEEKGRLCTVVVATQHNLGHAIQIPGQRGSAY